MKSKTLARIVSSWSVCCLLCVLSSCEKDQYYERPNWLEPPIYEVLQADGSFTNYLQAVDRTSYASVLQGAGLYTVFAPNDSAFNAFLTQKGYSSVREIPDSLVDKIVAYSICNSTYVFDSLGVGGSFKYKTQYYSLPYRDPEFNNNWVVDQTMESAWTTSYNNYKYLPAFTSAFFNSYAPSLTAFDYSVFYPGLTYTGKNIQGGVVLRSDIRAENGIIHEVSTVNMPLKNIADVLNEPENGLFKSLVDVKDINGNYLFRNYTEVTSPTTLKALQKIMPNDDIDRIYIKFYTNLTYSLNLENVLDFGTETYLPEKAGYTLILPKASALREYMNKRVLKYYGTNQTVPTEIIKTLVDAHMTASLVWPANYETSLNGNGDYLNGVGSAGNKFAASPITGGTLASNGFVYHSDSVVKSRIFESVYSEIFLNPAHKWSNIAYVNNFNTSLREDLQKCALNGFISERYTVLAFDDALLQADGFSYSLSDNTFSHSAGDNVNTNNRLTRLLREHIFAGLKNDEIDSEITDFATTGISNYDGWNFSVTSYGDPVRYKDNQMQAAGNIEDNTFVNLTKLNETYLNGTVWKVDGLLQYSPRVTGASEDKQYRDLTLWEYLDRARTQNPNVALFVDYLQKAVKKYPDDNADFTLENLSAEQFYTVLMPNKTAMQSAINAGLLPPLENVNSDHPDDFAKAAFFVYSHIIQGRVFVDDNIKGYLYPVNEMSPNRALVPVVAKVNATVKVDSTDYQLTNQTLLLEISKSSGGLLNFIPQDVVLGSKVLVDGDSKTVRVQRGKVTGSTIPNNYRSNRIACKAVLHEVNNYFNFKVAQ
ncbi:MAG: hypothetical protein GXY09_11050 [Bacteroidales bacterium]|nr:hypothetical protein [Bacteroidales bacterium]